MLFRSVVGGILAIPITAVLRALMFRYVWVKREEAGTTTGSQVVNSQN